MLRCVFRGHRPRGLIIQASYRELSASYLVRITDECRDCGSLFRREPTDTDLLAEIRRGKATARLRPPDPGG